MTLFKPKDHISLGEAVARFGRDLYPNDWTGKEFSPAVASTAKIDSDTHDYLIGWVERHCNTEDQGKKPLRARVPLSGATTERWNRAAEVYRIAHGMLDGIVSERPKDFPLGADDLDTLEAETAAFRAPRLAAHNRLLKAIQRMRRELYGTPPDCKDAIPALWCSPDKPPSLIDCEFWFGPDGLNRLRHAVQADCGEQGSSRIVVPLERVDAICALLEPEEEEPPPPNRPGRPSCRNEIEQAYRKLRDAGKIDFNKPRTAIFEKIRTMVREATGITKGLGADTIHKTIAPLFDSDKNDQASTR